MSMHSACKTPRDSFYNHGINTTSTALNKLKSGKTNEGPLNLGTWLDWNAYKFPARASD